MNRHVHNGDHIPVAEHAIEVLLPGNLNKPISHHQDEISWENYVCWICCWSLVCQFLAIPERALDLVLHLSIAWLILYSLDVLRVQKSAFTYCLIASGFILFSEYAYCMVLLPKDHIEPKLLSKTLLFLLLNLVSYACLATWTLSFFSFKEDIFNQKLKRRIRYVLVPVFATSIALVARNLFKSPISFYLVYFWAVLVSHELISSRIDFYLLDMSLLLALGWPMILLLSGFEPIFNNENMLQNVALIMLLFLAIPLLCYIYLDYSGKMKYLILTILGNFSAFLAIMAFAQVSQYLSYPSISLTGLVLISFEGFVNHEILFRNTIQVSLLTLGNALLVYSIGHGITAFQFALIGLSSTSWSVLKQVPSDISVEAEIMLAGIPYMVTGVAIFTNSIPETINIVLVLIIALQFLVKSCIVNRPICHTFCHSLSICSVILLDRHAFVVRGTSIVLHAVTISAELHLASAGIIPKAMALPFVFYLGIASAFPVLLILLDIGKGTLFRKIVFTIGMLAFFVSYVEYFVPYSLRIRLISGHLIAFVISFSVSRIWFSRAALPALLILPLLGSTFTCSILMSNKQDRTKIPSAYALYHIFLLLTILFLAVLRNYFDNIQEHFPEASNITEWIIIIYGILDLAFALWVTFKATNNEIPLRITGSVSAMFSFVLLHSYSCIFSDGGVHNLLFLSPIFLLTGQAFDLKRMKPFGMYAFFVGVGIFFHSLYKLLLDGILSRHPQHDSAFISELLEAVSPLYGLIEFFTVLNFNSINQGQTFLPLQALPILLADMYEIKLLAFYALTLAMIRFFFVEHMKKASDKLL